MSMKVSVVDLSHYDTVTDYSAVKSSGVVGVIYKATQGTSNQDSTYHRERNKAVAAGLKWGAYHFGDASDVDKQVANFLGYAEIDPGSLFCLDFEDYSSNTMSLEAAREFIEKVEQGLGRPGEMVLYSGNLIKEELGNRADEFFGSRRLWLPQYGSSVVVQCSWDTYWLWQYTGDGQGPSPHTVAGISGNCDCNYYDGSSEQLVSEWASGTVVVPPVVSTTVTLTIDAPPNIDIKIVYANTGAKC